MAAWLSIAQQATPHEYQGRVMSALFALADGLQAVGLMLAGALAGLLPTLALLNGQALLFFLAAALFWRMLAAPASPGRMGSTFIRVRTRVGWAGPRDRS
jgi:hypothetical protein